MVLILSEFSDDSTDKTIDWLNQIQTPFLRINLHDLINIMFDIKNSIFELTIRDEKYDMLSFSVFWYRRGDFSFQYPFSNTIENSDLIIKHLNNEWKTAKTFLHSLKKYHTIGSFDREINNNKILNLYRAKNCNLIIRNSLITSRKNVLREFIHVHQ